MFKLKYKIWIDKEGKVFGKGPYDLLSGVEKYGSLSESAKILNMSYNKAFNLIKDIEKKLGYELISTKIGGINGGGSKLTKKAKEIMDKYKRFIDECEVCLEPIFKKYFS